VAAAGTDWAVRLKRVWLTTRRRLGIVLIAPNRATYTTFFSIVLPPFLVLDLEGAPEDVVGPPGSL